MADVNPNPLPVPSTGPINRLPSAPNGQEGPEVAPGSTQTGPVVPSTISSAEDCLSFLSALYGVAVIVVSRKRVGSPPNSKPASVQVLHAGDAGEAIRLASVAAGVLQGA